MDKKSKIIMVVCIIVIVVAIGVATTIALINNNPNLTIDGQENVIKNIEDQTVEDTSTDVMDESELEEIFN